MAPLLEIRGLRKGFGGLQALGGDTARLALRKAATSVIRSPMSGDRPVVSKSSITMGWLKGDLAEVGDMVWFFQMARWWRD